MFSQENLWVAFRYGITAIGSMFAGYSWYNASSWEFWGGVVAAGLSAAYGQYKTTVPQQAKTLDKAVNNTVVGESTVAVINNIADKVR